MTRSIGLLSYKGVRIVFGMLLTCCFLSTFPPICRVMGIPHTVWVARSDNSFKES